MTPERKQQIDAFVDELWNKYIALDAQLASDEEREYFDGNVSENFSTDALAGMRYCSELEDSDIEDELFHDHDDPTL